MKATDFMNRELLACMVARSPDGRLTFTEAEFMAVATKKLKRLSEGNGTIVLTLADRTNEDIDAAVKDANAATLDIIQGMEEGVLRV